MNTASAVLSQARTALLYLFLLSMVSPLIAEGIESEEVPLSALQFSKQTKTVLNNSNDRAASDLRVVITTETSSYGEEGFVSYAWSASSELIIDEDEFDDSFTFNPENLQPGNYSVEVEINDEVVVRSGSISLNIISEMVPLGSGDSDGDGVSDENEGVGDADNDGVQDYLDSSSLPVNKIQSVSGNNTSFIVEVADSLKLSLGNTAFSLGNNGVLIDLSDPFTANNSALVALKDPAYSYPGGIYDFSVSNLSQLGSVTTLVVPQQSTIPANATYRKFINGTWRNFAEDASNKIASAEGERGLCPPPGDGNYVTGLIEGYWCVQLSIEDGGPNDADGKVNGSVDDPGGVATRVAPSRLSSGGCSLVKGARFDPVLLLMFFASLVYLLKGWLRVCSKAGR